MKFEKRKIFHIVKENSGNTAADEAAGTDIRKCSTHCPQSFLKCSGVLFSCLLNSPIKWLTLLNPQAYATCSMERSEYLSSSLA